MHRMPNTYLYDLSRAAQFHHHHHQRNFVRLTKRRLALLILQLSFSSFAQHLCAAVPPTTSNYYIDKHICVCVSIYPILFIGNKAFEHRTHHVPRPMLLFLALLLYAHLKHLLTTWVHTVCVWFVVIWKYSLRCRKLKGFSTIYLRILLFLMRSLCCSIMYFLEFDFAKTHTRV